MTPRAPSAAEERILHLLKTKGPRSAAALARRLHVSPTAVRQHLSRLLDRGLVAYREVPEGVGRPRRLWRATAAADAFFPDSHAELAVGMLAAAKDAFGAKGLARLLRERAKRQAGAYRQRLPPAGAAPAKRVAALARLRREEGYLATWRREPGGALLLVENHCPVCAAAEACVGLCDGELSLFRQVLGPGVTVERVEHILQGARRCAYRIVPLSS